MKKRKRKKSSSIARRSRIVAKRTVSRRRSKSGKKPDLIMASLLGVGSFFVGQLAQSFVDNKYLKTGLSASGLALNMVSNQKVAIASGTAISVLMTALFQFLNEDQKEKLKATGLVLAGDSTLELTPTQAKMLADAYQMALSGASNVSPLSGNSDYVLSSNDYVVSGSNSAQPFA